MTAGRLLVVVAVASVVLVACSSIPSKSEFVDQYVKTSGGDQVTALTSSGITRATATKLVRDNAACVYDGISSDNDLLQRAFDEGGDSAVEAAIRAKTQPCQAKLADALPRRGEGEMRRIATVLVLIAFAAAACGGVPDKADFLAKVRPTIGSDLTAGMHERGISKAKAESIIDNLIECQYDSIKGEPTLLQKAYDDPGNPDIAPQLDSHTLKCVEAMTNAITASATAPPPTTTTIAPSYPPQGFPLPASTVPLSGVPPTSAP